jgi:hypothetical protein
MDSQLGDKEVEAKIDEALKCIENALTPNYEKNILEACKQSYDIWYGFVKQSEIPRDGKWIGLFFGGVDIVNKLEELANNDGLMIRTGEWFMPSYGNALYLCLTSWGIIDGVRNLGAKEFFYFSEGKIDEWQKVHGQFRSKVMDCLVPAITRSQYIKTFTFTRDNWEELRKGSKDVYLFICHKPGDKLPSEVAEYIRWGESDECRTKIRGTRGGGRRCSEAEACRAREEGEARRWFNGWYDLGDYIPTPIMAIRQARYHSQFFLVKMPLVTYDAIITFIPKVRVRVGGWVFDPDEYKSIIDEVNNNVELDEVEVKALLAYLNSTFNWLWLEQNARYIAKGPLGLEVNIAGRMPILNVKAIDRGRVEELASLFDELETEARKLRSVTNDPPGDEEGGDGEREDHGKLRMFKELRSIFREIDSKIAEILGIYVDVDALWDKAWEMMERRIRGAGRKVTPGVKGVELITPTKRSRKGRRKRGSHVEAVPLTKWFEQEG